SRRGRLRAARGRSPGLARVRRDAHDPHRGESAVSVTFECPGCGTHSTFDAVRRSAEQSCPECDYPLFWATPKVDSNGKGTGNGEVAPADGNGLGPTHLRRPGIGGRMVPVGEDCPSCGERNVL